MGNIVLPGSFISKNFEFRFIIFATIRAINFKYFKVKNCLQRWRILKYLREA